MVLCLRWCHAWLWRRRRRFIRPHVWRRRQHGHAADERLLLRRRRLRWRHDLTLTHQSGVIRCGGGDDLSAVGDGGGDVGGDGGGAYDGRVRRRRREGRLLLLLLLLLWGIS